DRLDLPRRVRNLPRLDREDDRIDDAGRMIGGVDALDDEVAAHAVHAQPARAQRLERRAARDEDDIVPRQGELAAEVASYATDAYHRDPHGCWPFAVGRWPMSLREAAATAENPTANNSISRSAPRPRPPSGIASSPPGRGRGRSCRSRRRGPSCCP